ncbi:MAG: hypothetical protein JXB62_04030 [Pirellulales bacterium]|nr:hypothetical protein [Pirellulales bacterium]
MKKVKLNIDKQAIRQFFLQHVEKIVFAGFAICSVLIVFKAMGGDRYELTSDDLLREIDRAKVHIENSPPEPEDPNIGPGNEVNLSPFQQDAYQHKHIWNPPLFDLKLRPEPKLFSIRGLRGSAGMGAVNVPARGATDERGGKRGARWIVLTAIVPLRQQAEEYANCYANSVHPDPQKDTVEYLGYAVQRAEVTSPGNTANLDWSVTLWSRGVEKDLQTRFGVQRGGELVDEKYLDEDLTLPLLPWIDASWGPEVAHPPEIPLLANTGTEPKQPDPAVPADTREASGDNPFGGAPEAAPQQPQPTAGNPLAEDEESVEFKLFRVFDCTVEPGKQYCYRVQLGLKNPNDGVDPRYLAQSDLAERSFLLTAFSDPSEIISVPPDTQLLARTVMSSAAEPTGKIVVVRWVNETGTQAYEEFPVTRGKVLNYKGQSGSGDIDYRTNAIALDLRGGKRTMGEVRLDQPAEFLFLGPDGTLMVHNELDDLADYEKYTQRSDKPASDASQAPDQSLPGAGDDLGKQLGTPMQ